MVEPSEFPSISCIQAELLVEYWLMPRRHPAYALTPEQCHRERLNRVQAGHFRNQLPEQPPGCPATLQRFGESCHPAVSPATAELMDLYCKPRRTTLKKVRREEEQQLLARKYPAVWCFGRGLQSLSRRRDPRQRRGRLALRCSFPRSP